MASTQTLVELLGPYGISAINSAGATNVNASVWAGLIVGDGAAKTVTIMDGLSATGKTICVLDAPARGDYFVAPIILNSGVLTVSSVSASNLSFFFR